MFEDLSGLFRRYKEREQHAQAEKPKSKIIVVCNQKGGCAKTTTAINLSACLAKNGSRVLLLDLDPQAHASLGLGIGVDNLRWTIYDVLIHNVELEKVAIPTSVDNLSIAPANHLLSGAQLELANILGRESILKINFKKLFLNKHYDYCIIDTAPTLNLVTLNGLCAASHVLIPIQTHYFSLEGMKELFSTIEIVRDRLNSDIQILGILPTLFDGRMKINQEMLADLREYFQDLVLKTVIRNNSKIIEASRFRKPVIAYAPESNGAKDYFSLAQELSLIFSDHAYTDAAKA